jgi:hypothetical protein
MISFLLAGLENEVMFSDPVISLLLRSMSEVMLLTERDKKNLTLSYTF